jgi:alpha-galactosidase
MGAKQAGHAAHSKKAENLGIVEAGQRPLKAVFLGAGSQFLQPLFRDILSIPGADRGEIALVDVDVERLRLAGQFCRFAAEKMGKGWTVSASTERRDSLSGADYLINCVEVSGAECVRFDFEIPKKFGVDQCIGDTGGPGGLMKALRTVPTWLDILRDVEALCPDAWVLNYTNPMSILCLAAARASRAKVLGLCHSVQATSNLLAQYAGVPYEEMRWRCGGINHLAWFTTLEHQGKDLYPALKEKVRRDAALREKDPVRFDMMQHLGYFVTESSGHASEYLPYYRKRPDLLQQYCRDGYLGGSGFYAREWLKWRIGSQDHRRRLIEGAEPFQAERSWEYASWLVQSLETGVPFVAYCTVPNRGLIENLPADGVVEVACVANRSGVAPTRFGSLPPQCAAVCEWNMRMVELATIACLERSREAAVHSLMVDPLTSAVCSPAEIRRMADELFEAERAYIPELA